MADNIARLKSLQTGTSGKFKFLNYDVRQPYNVDRRTLAREYTITTSEKELLKTGFLYPSYKTIDFQNTINKTGIHGTKISLEFKLDIEKNCIVNNFYFFIQYGNSNTNINKNITHTSPMYNVETISLNIGSASKYIMKPEEFYIYNSIRLSHGDKMFTNLIDNFGLTTSYDIDASTNNIAPGSKSKWYFFAIPLFQNCDIPFNILTDNTNQCIIKVDLDANKFILPSSPNQSYSDLYLSDCKLIATQTFIPPDHYDSIVKYPTLDYRINDTQKSSITALDTKSLTDDSSQEVKITAKGGPCSLIIIGVREKNNLSTLASFIPINNVSISRDKANIKGQVFNTDILRNLNTMELDTGEFFLKKDLLAYTFDNALDRIIVMNHHGAIEVMPDEFKINFEVLDKTMISSTKSYEIIVMMYQPKLLRIDKASKDLKITIDK